MAHSHRRHHKSHTRKKFHHSHKSHHRKYNAVVEYRGLNRKTNFVKNQRYLIRNIHTHLKANNWKQRSSVSRHLESYIRNLSPVHQCNPSIFQSVCILGHVLSKEYIEDLSSPNYAARVAIEHIHVRTRMHPSLMNDRDDYITALVEREYDKHKKSEHREKEFRLILQEKGVLLAANLGGKVVDKIHHLAVDVAKAAIALQQAIPGINHDKDKDFGTNRHIFAILGPHTGSYGDVFIVFNREIMLHPDSNFSTTAATTYGQSRNAYLRQPWLADPNEEKKRIQCFHYNKLHCSVRGYETAAALSLMASTGLKNKTNNVKLREVQKWWRKQDPHFVFEAHLPSSIPLDNIADVYMPKSIFNSYSKEFQRDMRHFFGRSLIVTNHDVDQNDQRKPGDLTDPNSRASYQKYVNDKLTKKFSRRKQKPARRERGTVVTVPGSGFMKQVRMPMSIPQAYNHYLQLSKRKKNAGNSSPSTTYIYWQAMFGDMMLTVSNEPIHLRNKIQPNLQCLICYITSIPSSSADYFEESYSYLSNGTPLMHKVNLQQHKYKAGSNKFHRHCNFNDYITYRLKIEHNTGRVTLSHASSNKRQNKERLTYTFTKSTLDLNKLIYIHVSANENLVPIRNLTVQFGNNRHSRSSNNRRPRNSSSHKIEKGRHSASRRPSRHPQRRHSAPPTNRGQGLRHSSKHRRNSSIHRSRSGSLASIPDQHGGRSFDASRRSRSKSTGQNSRRSSNARSSRSTSRRKLITRTSHHSNGHHWQHRRHHSQ